MLVCCDNNLCTKMLSGKPQSQLKKSLLVISNNFYTIEATLRYGTYGVTQVFSETAALPLVLWPT